MANATTTLHNNKNYKFSTKSQLTTQNNKLQLYKLSFFFLCVGHHWCKKFHKVLWTKSALIKSDRDTSHPSPLYITHLHVKHKRGENKNGSVWM